MHIACTFFLSLGICTFLLSKSSYHVITIKNDSNHDISLIEFEQNIEKHKHTLAPHSDKKANFFKSSDYVEARVKLGNTTHYNVCSPITSSTKNITISQNQALHIRAQ